LPGEVDTYHAKRKYGTKAQDDSISPANIERRSDCHLDGAEQPSRNTKLFAASSDANVDL